MRDLTRKLKEIGVRFHEAMEGDQALKGKKYWKSQNCLDCELRRSELDGRIGVS